MKFLLLFSLFHFWAIARRQWVTEYYETCTAEQGDQARCGPGANCFIIGGVPTCHCVIDMVTGLPLAGNPYRACTWDLTGEWEVLMASDQARGGLTLNSPFTNDPLIVRIDRTDAILKTQYITGAIFVVKAVTSTALGLVSRVFLDVNDQTSVIMEMAEGFVDGPGRSLFFKSGRSDNSMTKKFPKKDSARDSEYLWGGWKKWDGSKIKIFDFKRKENRFTSSQWGTSAVLTPGWAYWYNDDSFGAPAARMSTALFKDETLDFERTAFDTHARFIQLGFFGYLSVGASTIHIISPADGKPIFTARKISKLTPEESQAAPLFEQKSLTLQGDQVQQLYDVAGAALGKRLLLEERESGDPLVFNGSSRIRKLMNDDQKDDRYPTVNEIKIIQPICLKETRADLRELGGGGGFGSKLDAMEKFKRPPATSIIGQTSNTQFDSIFPSTSFFGLEAENDSDAPYDFLWVRMAGRLRQAETDAEGHIRRWARKSL